MSLLSEVLSMQCINAGKYSVNNWTMKRMSIKALFIYYIGKIATAEATAPIYRWQTKRILYLQQEKTVRKAYAICCPSILNFSIFFFFVASVFQYSCCGCVPEPFIYYRNKNARQDKSCCCCCMSFHIFLSFHHFCAISAVTSLANSLILLYFCCCCCCSFIFLCSYTIRRRPTQRMCSEWAIYTYVSVMYVSRIYVGRRETTHKFRLDYLGLP